jgi:peroxiredoxin-like protein
VGNSYEYRAIARWTERRRGVVETDSAPRTINFSAPPEFQGEPGLWTPEHLLMAAVASCFVSTFRAMAEISGLAVQALRVSADGTLEKTEGGFRFTTITLRPVVEVPGEPDAARTLRLLQKTERSCFVARSLNSRVVVEPLVMAGSLAEPVA